jgi:hypothetical protein
MATGGQAMPPPLLLLLLDFASLPASLPPEELPPDEDDEPPPSAVPPLELPELLSVLLQAKTKAAATAAKDTRLTDLFSISASYNRSGDDRLKQGPKHPGRKTC